MKIEMTIQAGEGGQDARLLVIDQASIYEKYALKHDIKVHKDNQALGWLTMTFSGNKEFLIPLLENEYGGHRWQRISPTKKNKRIQTSSVTVAVWELTNSTEYNFPVLLDSDIEIRTQRGSGPGGQHRNKTDSCVFMKHIPTGITSQATGKCQHQNRRIARESLEIQIKESLTRDMNLKKANSLRDQKGLGMRGDKIRTYRERDNLVTTSNGKKVSLDQVKSGNLYLLWT